MQQREFLTRARKALIKHGIIGSRAKALLEEWNDHLQSEVEKLVAGGQDRESSYQDACKDLGKPESLVDSAAKQLAMESWQGRYPVLSSGILSIVVFLLGIFAMVAGGSLLKVNFEYLSSEMLKTSLLLLPWLLCPGLRMSGLASAIIIRKMPPRDGNCTSFMVFPANGSILQRSQYFFWCFWVWPATLLTELCLYSWLSLLVVSF